MRISFPLKTDRRLVLKAKSEEKGTDGTELLSYGLFTEKELRYLIDYNIMSGAMNKLAYYNLINNYGDYNSVYSIGNKKIYKKNEL